MDTNLKSMIHERTPEQEALIRSALETNDPFVPDDQSIRKIHEDIQNISRAIASVPAPKICLMSTETALMYVHNYQFGKDFTWCGIPIAEDNRIEYGKIVVMNEDAYIAYMEQQAVDNETPSVIQTDSHGKPELRLHHCRVCGARYFSKQEAKECARGHEWQNRRGRR